MKTLASVTALFILGLSLNASANRKEKLPLKKLSTTNVLTIQQPEMVWGAPEELDQKQIRTMDIKFPAMIWGKADEVNSTQLSIKLPAMQWGLTDQIDLLSLKSPEVNVL